MLCLYVVEFLQSWNRNILEQYMEKQCTNKVMMFQDSLLRTVVLMVAEQINNMFKKELTQILYHVIQKIVQETLMQF
jgi:hypothetical protein